MNNEITLDWDIDFNTVKDSVSWGVLKRFIKDNREEIGFVFMRKSSNGNVHILIQFLKKLRTLEQYQIRYLLRDDILRIKLDNLRDLIDHGEWNVGNYKIGGASGTGRLFDWKIKDGELGKAGEWEMIA